MKTFSEKERVCEATFASGGPCWHAYTNGKETPLLFNTSEDYTLAINVIAQSKAIFPGVVIIAFEVMENHFHFILSGYQNDIMAFWSLICKRLARFYPHMRNMQLHLKSIDCLQSLRNNIVYTHRNGYVVNSDHTPFSYPWGSGRYYFQDVPCMQTCGETKVDTLRKMFRGRAPQLPPEWKILDGHVSPASFCSVRFGMAMFRDAHHYFSMISKNVEAYSELAVDLDEGEFLTDAELFTEISKVLKVKYGTDKVSSLSKAQKFDLARILRHEFRSSNSQIRRLLGLTQYEVDSLFPTVRR